MAQDRQHRWTTIRDEPSGGRISSACLCELEGNPDVGDPRGWSVLDVQAEETGARMGLLLPAVQKFQVFRLRCDDEAVRGQ